VAWENGDVIAIDTGFDSQLKKFNAGWSGIKLIVVDKNIGSSKPTFKFVRIT
jgi:hypothetical protein